MPIIYVDKYTIKNNIIVSLVNIISHFYSFE